MKYWLDLNGDGYELKTIGEDEVIEEGKLSSLGIEENDPDYQDKLDRHFEEKFGILPEEWEVG